jgi:hypothetical protein
MQEKLTFSVTQRVAYMDSGTFAAHEQIFSVHLSTAAVREPDQRYNSRALRSSQSLVHCMFMLFTAARGHAFKYPAPGVSETLLDCQLEAYHLLFHCSELL